MSRLPLLEPRRFGGGGGGTIAEVAVREAFGEERAEVEMPAGDVRRAGSRYVGGSS